MMLDNVVGDHLETLPFYSITRLPVHPGMGHRSNHTQTSSESQPVKLS